MKVIVASPATRITVPRKGGVHKECTAERRVTAVRRSTPVNVRPRETDVHVGVPGIQGPPGMDSSRMTFEATAGEDISSNRVVCIKDNKAYYPNVMNDEDMAAIVGIAYTSAANGETCRVMTAGHLKEGAWSWSTGRIYCASNGQLTQTVPATGAVCEVGRAVDSHTIEVGIRPAILRA